MKKENITALKTLCEKEIVRIIRIWPQTLLPSIITMTLYFVIFGSLIGSRIGEMGGMSYMQFIVPGLIMMAVITNAYASVSSSFFSSKFQKSIEELLVSPISNNMIIIGYTAGGVFRGLAVGFLVTLVSLFFVPIKVYSILMVLSVIILTSLLFSLAGLLNGIFAKKFDDVAIVPTFVLTPLTYFAGVFYSISLLSAFWQKLSLLNPILYMVNAFRFGFLGISDINVYFALSMLIIVCIVLYFLCLHYLQKASGLRG